MTPDVMQVWRVMPMGSFFTIDGEVFKKNGASTAQYISNPIMGELYIGPVQAKAIKPYIPPTQGPALVVPPDPEKFETEVTERPKTDANFGATTVTITPADSKVEKAIQPSTETGKRKKSKKVVATDKPIIGSKVTEE